MTARGHKTVSKVFVPRSADVLKPETIPIPIEIADHDWAGRGSSVCGLSRGGAQDFVGAPQLGVFFAQPPVFGCPISDSAGGFSCIDFCLFVSFADGFGDDAQAFADFAGCGVYACGGVCFDVCVFEGAGPALAFIASVFLVRA